MEFDLSVDSEATGTDPSFPGMSDEQFNLDGADRPAHDETASAIDAAFNFEAPAPPSAPPAAQPWPPQPAANHSEDISAEELQGRADELMAEALEHYEAGQRAEALIVLDRLAILDEGNQAAKTFANHIRAELEAQSAAQGHEIPAQPFLAAAPAAAIDSPEIAEDLLADPVVEPTQEPASAAQIGNGMVDFEGEGGESLGLGAPQLVDPDAEPVVEEIDGISTGAAGEEFDLDESDPAEEPALETAAKPKLSMNKWLMVAGIVLLAMGGGYVALQFLGGSGGDSEAETTALAAPPPILDVEAIVGGSADPVPTEPADPGPSPAAAAATVPPGYLDEVLDRADAAYEDGDYAAAVLAYDEALKLDPQNEVARRRLEAAGEFYREQKEQLEQRGMATQAFNDGDYRNALRILYRISPLDEAEAERFERFKFNGWYNMGLRALKSGDCRLARSNLREAQQVDPTDKDLQWALELSGSCFEGQTEAYFDAARSLQSRAIDD
jgi:tetratricopeptide (TPR) repeat protein